MYFKEMLPEEEEQEFKSGLNTAWMCEAVSSPGGSARMETSPWESTATGTERARFNLM